MNANTSIDQGLDFYLRNLFPTTIGTFHFGVQTLWILAVLFTVFTAFAAFAAFAAFGTTFTSSSTGIRVVDFSFNAIICKNFCSTVDLSFGDTKDKYLLSY